MMAIKSGGDDIRIPRSINLNTVILIGSVAASFWAQQASFRERSDAQGLQISAVNVHLAATDAQVNELKSSLAETRQRVIDLADTLHSRYRRGDQ